MIGLPICAWLLASAPHLDRSGELLLELAQEAKVRLDVPRKFSDARIFLDRRGVPPMVAIRAVAKAMNATLVPSKSGYELARSSEQLEAIRNHRTIVRTGWLEARLKGTESYRKARLGEAKTGEAKGEEALVLATRKDVDAIRDLVAGRTYQFPASSAAQLMPCAELLEGLVSRIGLPALAQIPSGKMKVFETAPVPTSVPLPACTDLLTAYQKAANGLVDRSVPDLLDKEIKGEARGYLDYVIPAKASDVVRLRLECVASENGMWLNLECYDRLGKRLDGSRLFAGVNGSLVAPASLVSDAKTKSNSPWKELSAPAKDALAPLGKLGSKVPDWFFDPEKSDPLDLFVAEASADLAAEEKGPCVAYAIFDSWWSHVRGCVTDGRLSLPSLRQTLSTWLPYERVADTESVAWRPLDPEIAEARQTDRKALGRFAQAYARNGQVTARDKAHLYHDAGREIGTLPDVWSDIVRGQVWRNQSGADWSGRVYAFLGGISDTGWNLLLSGRTMTATQLGVVNDLQKLLEVETGLGIVAEKTLTDLQRHPLELYGTDVGSTPIMLAARSKPVVKFWRASEEENSFWMPSEALTATFDISGTFHLQNGEWVCRFTREKYEKLLDPFTIQTATSSCLSLAVGLPQGVRMTGDGPADVGQPSNPFTYASLPEATRAEQWKRVLQLGMQKARSQETRDEHNPERGIGVPPVGPMAVSAMLRTDRALNK